MTGYGDIKASDARQTGPASRRRAIDAVPRSHKRPRAGILCVMGTVREEFDLRSRTLTVHQDAILQTPASESTIEIVERAHADFESGARYVSFFIPDGPLWAHAIKGRFVMLAR